MNDTLDRNDRLYALLPAIYRIRDTDHGLALKALLRVIAEQVNVVEDDIAQLYDNWFIETAQDWVVPYIADLIGYRPVHEAGEPGDARTPQGMARNKILIPRHEVANTIAYRRRKGTLALLEVLANDVAGWPARAVEYFKLLGWTQNLNHQHLERGQTANLRDMNALDVLGTPFEQMSHTADVRAIQSARSRGLFNIPSVGLFVWRLKAHSVTYAPAYCVEEAGPHNYTFSVLGQDTPLHIRPQPEPEPTHIAEELNLPAPIRRSAFERNTHVYYGPDLSLAIWAPEWSDSRANAPIPIEKIVAADLSDWQYRPARNTVAVDPMLGRIAFPPNQLPKKNVRVSYHQAFSVDMGGGEYERALQGPKGLQPFTVAGQDALKQVLRPWMVGEDQFDQQPQDAIIEISDSNVYVLPLNLYLKAGNSLQLRAANRKRPVIRLLDWQTDLPDALTVTLEDDAQFTLDGLLITGRAVHVRGKNRRKPQRGESDFCTSRVRIRHCTLVPGWGLDNDCEPKRPAEPSLELFNTRAQVSIEHSIAGSIQVNEDEVHTDPIPLRISDSIVDATAPEKEAIGAPGHPVAHCALTVQRSTVFGIVDVHAIELAENSIFTDCVNVARRQLGCMRFCYVPPGCRTPKRHHCEPEHAEQTAVETIMRERSMATPEQLIEMADEARELTRERVRPRFTAARYGKPGYCQLAEGCADEIKRGADDESEMGVFHDLFQPQREANLRARLDEYMPSGMQAGVIFAN